MLWDILEVGLRTSRSKRDIREIRCVRAFMQIRYRPDMDHFRYIYILARIKVGFPDGGRSLATWCNPPSAVSTSCRWATMWRGGCDHPIPGQVLAVEKWQRE